ncbi:MAG: hypothetical protein C0467_14495 [Planctomycetaceae bacterium]|nr:hypothetical protein [Planctomycetaceae bacterium]
MRKLLFGMLLLIGMTVPTQSASAWHSGHSGPWPQTVAFPTMNPPGWYRNAYYYAWQYPWFAYYNYSHGPYANWMSGGGYAYYGNVGYYPMTYPVMAPPTTSGTCTMTINLPADAKLLFNGTVANGTGGVRTFKTPALQSGVDYAYELTAEVMRGGKAERVTERVIVRAGETKSVTLTPAASTAVGSR